MIVHCFGSLCSTSACTMDLLTSPHSRSKMSSAASSPPAQTASAVVVIPFLLLQFTSGIFVPVHLMPDWILTGASLFPLLWMAQGMRAAFFPDEMAVMEASGAWDLPMVALVLGGWCVVGLVLTLLTFRWKTRKDG